MIPIKIVKSIQNIQNTSTHFQVIIVSIFRSRRSA